MTDRASGEAILTEDGRTFRVARLAPGNSVTTEGSGDEEAVFTFLLTPKDASNHAQANFEVKPGNRVNYIIEVSGFIALVVLISVIVILMLVALGTFIAKTVIK